MGQCRVFRVQSLRGFGLQPNTVRGNAQQLSEANANHASMRADLRRRQDQTGIHVGDGISSLTHAFQGLAEKDYRVRILPLRVGWGKQRSDIGCGHGSEQRVSDGVEQDIPIGVSAKSQAMGELDAANFQRNSGTELVGVESVAQANRKFRVLSFKFGVLFEHLWDLSSSWRTCRLLLEVELRE